MTMRRISFGLALTALLALSLPMGLTGCASKTGKGAAIGASAGAVIGGIIGSRNADTAEGAIIGAAIGGAAGAIIGNYMDRQAKELDEDLENAKVERVGEGIKITFDGGLLFDYNSAELRPEVMANLVEMAKTLNKYPDTNVRIDGHTDSSGAEAYNLKLSERRAAAVAAFLAANGVERIRVTTYGFGEEEPIASNATAEGRQLNRRVEVAIIANEKLKRWAQNQTAGR